MNEATVFSQPRRVIFAQPVTRTGLEVCLKKFLAAVGEPLSYNGVILGHIKVMARIPQSEDFLFLSLTKMDSVCVQASPTYYHADNNNIDSIDLIINVLLFGSSRTKVAKVVDTALALMPSTV